MLICCIFRIHNKGDSPCLKSKMMFPFLRSQKVRHTQAQYIQAGLLAAWRLATAFQCRLIWQEKCAPPHLLFLAGEKRNSHAKKHHPTALLLAGELCKHKRNPLRRVFCCIAILANALFKICSRFFCSLPPIPRCLQMLILTQQSTTFCRQRGMRVRRSMHLLSLSLSLCVSPPRAYTTLSTLWITHKIRPSLWITFRAQSHHEKTRIPQADHTGSQDHRQASTVPISKRHRAHTGEGMATAEGDRA